MDTYIQTEVNLYVEPCDCGSHVRHNNGGNYHRQIYLETFCLDDRYAVVLVDTTSRETFPGDKHDHLRLTGQEFEIVREIQDRDDLEYGQENYIARFRQGEAQIVAQFTE